VRFNMKSLSKLSALSLILLFSSSAMAGGKAPLSFTQMNIKWFGLNGSPNEDGGNETRVQSIRAHLENNNLLSDVMVFEEIVDVELLTTGILEDKYRCHSYDRPDPKHQHVVLCHLKKYRLDPGPGTKDLIMDELDLNGRLRPAVHGVLKDYKGRSVFHIIAVHLKAMPDMSEVRMQQVKLIADYLASIGKRTPVAVMGDFNTYGSDPEDISDLFADVGLEEVHSPEDFSWASASESYPRAKFDRTWMSHAAAANVKASNVVGPCNNSTQTALETYNRKVSDHCAVKIEFQE